MNNQWVYTDDKGSFRWQNPTAVNELYFPLCNELGVMSSITPVLHGDIKTDQNHFLLLPVSVEDLHNSKASRNFWIHTKESGTWSLTGNSARDHQMRFEDSQASNRIVEAGLLWHKTIFENKAVGFTSSVLNFVPTDEIVEIMMVTIQNTGHEPLHMTPTAAIPVYGRSAENIRDHRHVTALVNRPVISDHGLTMQPVIRFDETGHQFNHTQYYVFGAEDNGTKPIGTIGAVSDFIGQQGDLEWPEAVVKNLSPAEFSDTVLDGKECIAAIRFEDITLNPGSEKSYVLVLGFSEDNNTKTPEDVFQKFNSIEKVQKALDQNIDFWTAQATKATFTSGQDGFANWAKWIELQPVLRKIYGCSFLPYHDYGKGGRGWRDLWQDCLSLILLQPEGAKDLLINNFGGVRIDGTNATIIGSEPGAFVADRNNIPRVWMDHGSWPYLTTLLYINQSGDYPILLEEQSYFKDALTRRAKGRDKSWHQNQGNVVKDTNGQIITGSILEHILIQHLSIFFNVGEHNMLLLEGADWNDTLDMARERGESVAFSAMYASNLLSIAELLKDLKTKHGIESVELIKALQVLLDTSADHNYDSIDYKHNQLSSYYDLVSSDVSGEKVTVDVDDLIHDLEVKGNWLSAHIRDTAFIELSDDIGFFNGYYNEDGLPVGGVFEDATRFYLTGQVFTTMFGLASQKQIQQSYNACRKYLKDPATGGYKLNTPLGPNQLNFGRGFSFAYGEKENGAIFSHMVVMYMNALYKQNFVDEAFEVFESMYRLCNDTEKSKIYPGVPEYFRLDGKGMYHYLTGSASWLFLTLVTEMYGIKGDLGDLCIEPKLVPAQFDEAGKASIRTSFADHALNIVFVNKDKLSYNDQTISALTIDGNDCSNFITGKVAIKISRDYLAHLDNSTHEIVVTYR